MNDEEYERKKQTLLHLIDLEVGRKEDIIDEHYRIYTEGFINGLRASFEMFFYE